MSEPIVFFLFLLNTDLIHQLCVLLIGTHLDALDREAGRKSNQQLSLNTKWQKLFSAHISFPVQPAEPPSEKTLAPTAT